MTEHKNPTDINEVLPPSLAAVREIFSEFNVSEVSDEIFCHYTVGHTCDVIEEAKAVSHHAGRTKIEEDDVQLAINSVTDGLMFAPPYRDQLLAYAEKNEQPLPAVRPHCGIRLPAERFTLTAPNYSLLPCADNAKTNPSSELVGDSSMALHISNPVNSTKNIFRAINPSVRPITVGNPMGPSVHVIAAPGMGPSMIRVQTVQNVTQLSNVDTSTGLRTLPVGPTVSSVMSLNRRFMDTS
uniref:Transcription initiation factor TFIID subunit 9 n=1 Tax=Schistosoma mansoni TaxID=6183 RepID=A0A5K4EUR4_SCHMA